ncbi:hypothetical protein SAMN05443633_101100 [Chryseobacterium arachidis]|uniref:Uncharacterized protein n=1 Tax=Chryseobacterium arachidis TaxID=1416778 RepID=A0A1M4SXZ2_9FLAO|nr:hypothetical protein [Chryseobacterium arachidis]SHE37112.1 hypothetical protein SAMN05443633_101100 [Chryseobacterium arachidis]
MKNLIVLLILNSFLLSSCTKSSLEQKITEKNSFWYIYASNKEENIYENINYGYKFYPDGSIDYKGFDFSTNSLKNFRMDDVKQIMKWNYQQKDNVLKIENKTYDVLKFKEDTLILQYSNDKKKRILINLQTNNPTKLKSFRL